MPCVYTNTHSTSLPRFIFEGDMKCTNEDQHFFRNICSNKQVADITYGDA
jgi:hypothetical protein